MSKVEHFDVFLSYRGSDGGNVEKIALQLLAQGLQPWFDKWQLLAGEPIQDSLELALAASSHCAVFIGPTGTGPWQKEEVRAAIRKRATTNRGRKHGFRVIPVFLPGSPAVDSEDLPAFLMTAAAVRFRSDDDKNALQRLISGITGVPSGPHLPTREARLLYKMVLTGTFANSDEPKVDALVRQLRTIAGDASLTVKKVMRGSIVLFIEGTASGFNRLMQAFAAHDLAVSGHEVKELLALTSVVDFAQKQRSDTTPEPRGLTKHDIVAKIAQDTGITKTAAAAAIDSLIDGITRSLKKGDAVSFVGFGTFKTSNRKARMARNPQTGDAIKLPKRRVPRFIAGKALKSAIDKG